MIRSATEFAKGHKPLHVIAAIFQICRQMAGEPMQYRSVTMRQAKLPDAS